MSFLRAAVLLLLVVFVCSSSCFWLSNPFLCPLEKPVQPSASAVGGHSVSRLTVRPKRIVAVGDLHGDFENAEKVLQMMKIIDTAGNWIGGDSILVQTGDLVDRGPHSKRVMDLMIRLSQEAPLHNGRVIVLMGNHEVMNIQGDLRYVHPEDYAAFGGTVNRREAFGSNGVYGRWLRSLDALVVVNDTLFVHAGLHPVIAQWGVDLVNRKFKAELMLPEPDEWSVLGMHGVVWTRVFDPRANHPNMCGLVDVTLSLVKASRMIVGHTVQESGRPTGLCGMKLILNDVGICKFYGGALAATEIVDGVVRFVSSETDDPA